MFRSIQTALLATTLALGAIATANTATAQDPRTIAAQVDENSRSQNDSSFSVMKITTCKFGISNGKVRCISQPTVKSLESASINTGPGGKDTQSIAFVLEPASEKGIGMLSFAYDSPSKANETYLYLSALGKVKRIVSSRSGSSEPVSLFGSEFTTEDQETGKIDDYTYKLLETVTYQGRKTYVIERTPTAAKARSSRYAKTVEWVDAGRYLVVKASMYDKRGTEIRRILADNLQKMNGVWMARSITIMNLVANRLSNMNIASISFGVSVDPALMSQRALTDKAFRERQLAALRAQAR